MLHRIREMMADEPDDKLTGTVEVDEAYIGGSFESMNRKRRRAVERAGHSVLSAKAAVVGMVERKGRVRAWALPDTKHKTLIPKLVDSIHHDATVYTDQADLYRHINEYFLHYASVNHGIKEYVRNNVHTNNIEAFWSVLKRTIGGTYTHVNPRHLDRYLAEQAFRFNAREEQDGPRFAKATKGADGKRLTYKALISKR
jgi:transposase-like protein